MLHINNMDLCYHVFFYFLFFIVMLIIRAVIAEQQAVIKSGSLSLLVLRFIVMVG